MLAVPQLTPGGEARIRARRLLASALDSSLAEAAPLRDDDVGRRVKGSDGHGRQGEDSLGEGDAEPVATCQEQRGAVDLGGRELEALAGRPDSRSRLPTHGPTTMARTSKTAAKQRTTATSTPASTR